MAILVRDGPVMKVQVYKFAYTRDGALTERVTDRNV